MIIHPVEYGIMGESREGVEQDVVQNLIESMTRSVAAVVKVKGGYTKY